MGIKEEPLCRMSGIEGYIKSTASQTEKKRLNKSSKICYQVVMNPNPTLMGKCIDIILSVPTVRMKFRDGVENPQGAQL